MGFGKRKKRPEISSPTNFEHRVHSGFDHNQGVFIGLPAQWNSIINETDQLKLQQNLTSLNQLVNLTENITLASNEKNPNTQMMMMMNINNRNFQRPKPIVDPSRITPTELTCFKTIVRGQQSSAVNPATNTAVPAQNSLSNNLNQSTMPSMPDINSIVANSNALRQQQQQNNINSQVSNNMVNNASNNSNVSNCYNNRHQPLRNINSTQQQQQQQQTYPAALSPVAEATQLQSNPNITKIIPMNNDVYSNGNQNVEYVYNVNGS